MQCGFVVFNEKKMARPPTRPAAAMPAAVRAPVPAPTPAASAKARKAPNAQGQPGATPQTPAQPQAGVVQSQHQMTGMTNARPTQPNTAVPARPGMRPTGARPGAQPARPISRPMEPLKPPEAPNQIISKRKIQELVEQIDPREKVDADVEAVLLEIADDFIDSVATFACSLAKHRRSDTLEAKDVQLHLEHNWNIHVPGFDTQEAPTTVKKPAVSEPHKQRLALIKKATSQVSTRKSAS